MKRKNNQVQENRKFIIIVILSLLAFTGLFLILALVFKVNFPLLNSKWSSSNVTTPAFLLNQSALRQKDDYKKYTIAPEQVGDTYYVSIRNVLANGAPDPVSGTTPIFNVSITVEAENQEASVNIINKNASVVDSVRGVMSYVRPRDINNEKSLLAIKNNVKANIESRVGAGTVKDVYFEGIIGHD